MYFYIKGHSVKVAKSLWQMKRSPLLLISIASIILQSLQYVVNLSILGSRESDSLYENGSVLGSLSCSLQ